ncbi:MAG: hypothetical protein M3A24_02510 [Candidatus Rhabdochlamydia oedothoracis]|nr:hypothetical protein [Candidatus Rhabdochlamydia oedothoracis]
MILRLGFICALLTSSFAYSNQDTSNIAIEFDDEDEDYSSIEEDLRLLEEEDRLHN